MNDTPPVCDYEGSDYRTRFWENEDRSYEDQAERVALRRMMPPTGSTLIEIGAGFGRLADEYRGYDKVVLFDYSRTLLREAQQMLGDDPRFIYVAGNWYNMPFVNGLFDTMVQIRTIHHAADVPSLFAQLARIARPNGRYILEFANKQNLKAIARYWLKKQQWSPFDHAPIEFVELNYDFHPQYIRTELTIAGFTPGDMLTVSHYRIDPIKKVVPTGLLVSLDSMAQKTGNWWQLSPSVFVDVACPADGDTAVTNTFFACPTCITPLDDTGPDGTLQCPNPDCAHQWRVENSLYDFKEPI